LILFQFLKKNLGISFSGTVFWILFILTSFTPIDVFAHEIGKWRGSNPVRLILGIFIGVALACAATAIFEGKPAIGLGLIFWMVLLEFLTAALMKWRGCLDALVRRYESGIRRNCGTKTREFNRIWGYVPIDKQGAQLLFRVISDSYERRSLIITTNLEFSKWARFSPTTRWPRR
jgi:hypothetical protein